MMFKNKRYNAPDIDYQLLEPEGLLCQSGQLEDFVFDDSENLDF